MFRADLGDFLYIIVVIVLVLAGSLEKFIKKKKQESGQNTNPAPMAQEYDDEDETEIIEKGFEEPKSLEDMIKRMMQSVEEQKRTIQEPEYEPEPVYPVEAESLEEIPENRFVYNETTIKSRIEAPKEDVFLESEDEGVTYSDFDIRQAIIASEILNRKY